MRRVTVVGILGLLLVGVGAGATPLTILYTNDLHLRFERLDALERLIAEQRDEVGDLLLVDAGDAWHDFRRPTTAVCGADAMVAWMNRVAYDAMALGNHDMYWGSEHLEELAAEAAFPMLCANIQAAGIRSPPFVPSVLIDVNGASIALIGLVGAEFLAFSAFPSLAYVAPDVALRETLERLPDGLDAVIVVAHLPVAEAARIARHVSGIDVFITGHSHEETLEPVPVGDTIIVQAGCFGAKLGRLDVEIEADRADVSEHRLIPTEKAPVDLDRSLLQLGRVIIALSAILLLVVLPTG